jgi:ABC-type multidrug transport system ATPase subunit
MLDAIAGRLGTKGKLKGQVRFNGQVITGQLRRKVLSYVAQEDTLYGNFTVMETLKFAARFHFGYTISHREMTARAEVLIERLGLASCTHTHVGDLFRKGLSGEIVCLLAFVACIHPFIHSYVIHSSIHSLTHRSMSKAAPHRN